MRRCKKAASQAPVADVDEYIEKTIGISYDVPRLSPADVATLIEDALPPLVLTTTMIGVRRIELATPPTDGQMERSVWCPK